MSEIEMFKAENKQLREALEPLIDYAEYALAYDIDTSGTRRQSQHDSMRADIDKARAALGKE
jgi:hypothetical protein